MTLLFWVASANAQVSAVQTRDVRIERSLIERTRMGVAIVLAGDGSGSGFFVRFRDQIVCITNWHVIRGALDVPSSGQVRQVAPVIVQPADGQRIPAFIWKSSPRQDLAIFTLNFVPRDVRPLEMQEVLPPDGSAVFVWGAPYGESLVPLDGQMSRASGRQSGLVEINISIAPGSSGGPLLTPSGFVIGVVSQRSEGTGGTFSGRGYAISARNFWPHMLRTFEDPPRANPAGLPQ